MIITYDFFGQDNKSFMYDYDNDSYKKCPNCNNRLGYEINPNFKLHCKKYDVSYTYDGFLIVSQKFKFLCEENSYKEVSFINLPLEQDFFVFQTNDILKFDYERRKVDFIKLCEKCNRFDEVIGITPAFLKDIKEEIKEGFFRSDLIFGSGNDKSPLIIIGTDTYKKLKAKKLKGIDFDPIYI